MKSAQELVQRLKTFFGPHPLRDWVVIATLLFVIFMIVVVFAVYLFLGIRTGRIVGSVPAENLSAPKVTRGEIKEVLDRYELRRVNFDAGNFPERTFSDPN